MPSRETKYERLESLLRGPEGERIRSLDREMRLTEPTQISIILATESSRLTRIGNLLTNTDRELRRVTKIVGVNQNLPDTAYSFGTVSRRPSPIGPWAGGLQVEDANIGSLYLLVKAYGYVLSLLTSKPVAALTALITLSQGAGSIHLWPRRRHDPLAGVSARQLLDIIKELGGNPAELLGGYARSLEISTRPAISEFAQEEDDQEHASGPPIPLDLPPEPSDKEGIAEPRSPAEDEQEYIDFGPPYHATDEYEPSALDEATATGRRITYIREYPDGTREVIYVEG